MRRLYQRGLTTALGGNVSMRAGSDCIAITPSGIDKGRIRPDQIGIVGLDGVNRTSHLKASIETGMHLAVYRARADVNAVLHAHPPCGSFFAVSTADINCRLLAEARQVAGVPVRIPYVMQGTPALAKAVAEAVTSAGLVLMSNHGVLSCGSSMTVALDRIEVLESAARMTVMGRVMGGVSELSASDLAAIDAMRL